jgi:peptidoglycan/xylan/chitin deacetylase (PgdA/CDA1 family)
MEVRPASTGRRERGREQRPQPHVTPSRLLAIGSLLAVGGVAAAIVFSTTGGSGSHAHKTAAHQSSSASARTSTTGAAGKPGTAAVPILAYHVINVAPATSSAPPALYVPVDEFTSQMNALKAAGWHAVTLDQLEAYWTHGTSLGPGKPIVITFDDGYASQYTNALPVLKRLGWVAVENIAVTGLTPSDGGLTDAQVHGLLQAGWQLGAEGPSTAKLTTSDPTLLDGIVLSARQTLQSRYGVALNWFAYPAGAYDSTIVAAVRSAGFVGATTLVSGWASPSADRFRLPRLQVVGGTSPTKLISQIAAASQTTVTPGADQGIGTT